VSRVALRFALGSRDRPGLAAAVAGALAAALAAGPAGARVHLTTEEALALAFPGCDVERSTVYLTASQSARARELAGAEVSAAIVHPYRATCAGRPGGVAYFDAHTVRTLPEALMVVVDPEGRVARVEVLSFSEPADYLPRDPFYEQFRGRSLDAELELRRGVRGVTGATLTARATTAAVRRVLAIHRALTDAEESP
jgi:hypothetical protein